jgi:hypothetical protein
VGCTEDDVKEFGVVVGVYVLLFDVLFPKITNGCSLTG